MTVVALREPLRIHDALDAIAGGDATRLGTAEQVPLQEQFAWEMEHAPATRADRERLMRQ